MFPDLPQNDASSRFPHLHNLSRYVLPLAVLLLAAVPAAADTRIWDAGGDGVNWEDNCNWSGPNCGFQPFDADNAVIPVGTLPFPEISFVEGIARLEVQANTGLDQNGALTVHFGGITNNGLITIADNGQLRVEAGMLDGGGEVVLADGTTPEATITGSPGVSQAAAHTIRGEGGVAGTWTNNGLIIAEERTGDSSAMLSIDGTMVNHGVIRSSATGSLHVTATLTNSPTGQVIADTNPIILGSLSTISGTMDVLNGGKYVHTGTGPVTMADATINGDFDVLVTNGSVIGTGTGITNNGVMTIDNMGVANGELAFASGTTLGGVGEVVLNRANTNTKITGGSFTHGSNHTIRGVGVIQATLVNNGSILAEPRNGTVLQVASTITNNAVMQANSGATLRLESGATTQGPQGRIRAVDGGVVELVSALVTGGRLETEGSGRMVATASPILTNVTNAANLQIPVANTLRLAGSTFTNEGVLTVNSSGAINAVPTLLTFDNSLTLQGTGRIELTQSGNNARITTLGADKVITQLAGHTIRGQGTLSDGDFVNHGRLEGLSSAQPLVIQANLSGDGTLQDVSFAGAFTQFEHVLGDVGTTAIVPVTGTYNLGRNGSLLVDLGGTTAGTEYDQLNATGAVTLSSTVTRLEVSILQGFVPSAGDRFTVVTTADMLTGTFGTVVLPSLITNHALTWKPIQYTNHDAILEVLSVTPFVVDGDFNDDGLYNCFDVDSLVNVIAAGTDGPLFDLTGDGFVNQDDLNDWLTEAGGANLPSHNPYLPGDANLDGSVDGSDFNIWNSHKFASIAAWCSGDFTADGVVDGSDFNIWNSRKFTSADGLGAVPEPRTFLAVLLAVVMALRFRSVAMSVLALPG